MNDINGYLVNLLRVVAYTYRGKGIAVVRQELVILEMWMQICA